MKKILPISIVIIIVGFFLFSYINKSNFFLHEVNTNSENQDGVFAEQKDLPSEDFQVLNNIQSNNFFFDEHGNITFHVVSHVETPESVRGVYMTSWIASRKDLRGIIHKQIIENDSINSVVIDIKDATGKIAFEMNNPIIQELGSSENRIRDIRDFIEELHKDGIYVIGRVSVFQDPYLIKQWPDEAIKKVSNPTENWVDKKGIGWIDASSEKVWDYVNIIAEESYKLGFDEINFDYIRFPSDGNMKDVLYTLSEGKNRSEVLESFFKYTHDRLSPQGIIISADIFGMTAVNTDDLGIGQILEKTIPYFDFVCPMVYPSHFPNGWAGIPNPAEEPYKVIHKSMESAVNRVIAMGEDPKKLRPWLQDFNLGATYTKELVEAQITATYDVGLVSWLMWDPRNTYTISAFK